MGVAGPAVLLIVTMAAVVVVVVVAFSPARELSGLKYYVQLTLLTPLRACRNFNQI